jgi:type VI secretion system secreted protein VgrG
VKVQFHWDREGKNNEESSCWVRVSHPTAGKNWGWISLPRIGQEVIVSFLEGNPDRPIITGRVYNGEQMPPYTLPANQTQSGMKTRSSKQGTAENFHEIRFEDKKDSEEVYVHAEKDFNCVIENNETRKIGLTKKDKGDQTVEIQNNRTVTLNEGNDTLTVKKGNRVTNVDTGNNTLNVKKGNRETNVNTGNNTLTVKQGNQTVNVNTGNDTKNVKMGNHLVKVSAGKSTIEAMQSIELKVGSNSVKIDQTGVTIKGLMVKIEATTTLDAKGLKTSLNGDAMLTLKGGITMIN